MKFLIYLIISASVTLMLSVSPDLAFASAPSCQDEKVLRKIVKRFNQTEKIYWQGRNLTLTGITDPHLHNDTYLQESPFARQYCHATAHFADHRKRKMHFLIEDGAGFAGVGWNVEYCIHGLDPWKYYDGRCRVLSK